METTRRAGLMGVDDAKSLVTPLLAYEQLGVSALVCGIEQGQRRLSSSPAAFLPFPFSPQKVLDLLRTEAPRVRDRHPSLASGETPVTPCPATSTRGKAVSKFASKRSGSLGAGPRPASGATLHGTMPWRPNPPFRDLVKLILFASVGPSTTDERFLRLRLRLRLGVARSPPDRTKILTSDREREKPRGRGHKKGLSACLLHGFPS